MKNAPIVKCGLAAVARPGGDDLVHAAEAGGRLRRRIRTPTNGAGKASVAMVADQWPVRWKVFAIVLGRETTCGARS